MNLLALILSLPLLSALYAVFARKNVENAKITAFTAVFSFAGLFTSIFIFLQKTTLSLHFDWVSFVHISIDFYVDKWATLMLMLVHFVAMLVQIFSISYLKTDANGWRYAAYVELFVFAMLGLVLSQNLLVMYFFWELVGLSSYLLIGFWHEKPRAVWAAKKAFLYNRVGDAGFLIGIVWLIVIGQSIDFQGIGHEYFHHQTIIGLLLFMGCMGKSAQWPLSGWLPDAMEGPTPVSALIHAATMVAAGIFMLLRIHPLLSQIALSCIAIVGAFTMFWGACRAIVQTDIKKLLAYSTISQLGLMVLAMGVNAPEAAMFHLFTHAFFKAGLFLVAGAIIHALHTQDITQMGGLRQQMPFTFWVYTLCGAALAGLPFTSGFLSKDAIVLSMIGLNFGTIYIVITLISSFLTAFYITKQWKGIFFEKPVACVPTSHSRKEVCEDTDHGNDLGNRHDADNLMKIALAPLAIGALFILFSINPLDAASSWFFNDFANIHLQHNYLLVSIFTLTSIFGVIVGYKFSNIFNNLFIINKIPHWYDIITDTLLPKYTKQIARLFAIVDIKIIDRIVNGFAYLNVILAHSISRFDTLVVDGLVNGSVWITDFVGNRTRKVQGGTIQAYILALFMGIILLICWLI